MKNRLVIEGVADTRSLLEDLVVASDGLEQFLEGLVGAAAACFADDGADTLTSITLLRPRRPVTITGSSSAARHLAGLQYRFDNGPCMQAASSGRMVVVTDFASDGGFPLYGSAALRSGVRSALGVPIQLNGPEQAAITYSSSRPRAFSEGRVRAVAVFAEEASRPLKLALRVARLTEKTENLTAAMESRTTIDLAAGVIMAQNRCSQHEAIEILRAASSASNIKLRDLAQNVLSRIVDAPVTTHFD